MHSVFRIIAEEPGLKPVLVQIMEKFNAVEPNLFGPMKKIDAISATVSEDGSWEVHCNEIKLFVSRFLQILKSHRLQNLCYHVDVCIHDHVTVPLSLGHFEC